MHSVFIGIFLVLIVDPSNRQDPVYLNIKNIKDQLKDIENRKNEWVNMGSIVNTHNCSLVSN